MKTAFGLVLLAAPSIGRAGRPSFARALATAATSRSPSPSPPHRYYILRHGETDANASGRIQGSSDASRLTERGRAQAAEVAAAAFSGVVGGAVGTVFSAAYVSPLTRARETLSVVRELAGPGVLPPAERVLTDLREIDFYGWEGRDKADLMAEFPDSYRAWKVGDSRNVVVEGRLPVVEVWERAASVWEVVRADAAAAAARTSASASTSAENHPRAVDGSPGADGDGGGEGTPPPPPDTTPSTLLVCHGTLGQALLCAAFGRDETHFRLYEFPNCGLAEIVWHGDEKLARSWRWHHPTPSELSSM